MSNNPFELLLEMERNSKAFALPLPSTHIIGATWQGMGFSCAEEHFVIALNEIKEVINFENMTSLPSSESWFLGVSNVRGHVLPITDLQDFIIGTPITKNPQSKVLVIDVEKLNVGFLVERILGVQRFPKDNLKILNQDKKSADLKQLDERFIPYIQGTIIDQNSIWYILNLKALSQTPEFYHIVKEIGG